MSGSDSPTFFHGQPWSSWIEKIGRDKPLSDDETEDEPRSSVMRLAAEDIDLYGFCPERDAFYGVVCEICNAIVKPQALIQHMEIRHPSGTVNLPPPANPVVKPIAKTAYCKVSKLKKTQTSQLPSSSKTNNTTSNKRTAEQANLHPQLPLSSPRSPLENIPIQITNSGSTVGSSPVKSPGSGNHQRRKKPKPERSLLKDREYDPDRHCGVWNDETGKPCTRSLTCKAHTVSLRRTVTGRSKTFDKLLAEHRAAKEFPPARSSTKVTLTGTVTMTSTSSSSSSSSSAGQSLNAIVIGAVHANAASDSATPSSPPVLSLPDMYPLPKTKLEEDFANQELGLESSMVNSAGIPGSITAPISVLLPSLSPATAKNGEPSIATLVPATCTVSPAPSIVPASLPTAQPLISNILEAETPVELDSESITIYSPISGYKDSGKSQIIVQIPPSTISNALHSPISKSYTAQASMPCLSIFENSVPTATAATSSASVSANQIINGKRNNSHMSGSTTRALKRSKHDFSQEYSTAIQVEATTTSTPYPHFGDISWSNCHPEPLAVSRWLRITSNRKQYNFNIH
ncbi:ataxin-7-like protein 1 isoform X1 [Neodiprion pinetum]|uniref:Ataxin-7-like protein 1 isoform X1 n=2 Tax=Neodiprion lecontei TaxID=441921 RepID=A0A6J0BFA3_NEOLC|nr:ataxin-7-like protein 1 isoform X1 [Neodiprion lecontei]XP_046424621.1 ataxin-7-like protein 1 isoform X1 [Neodiprion fabricii]XP_046480952.1 ataxin-7-like protein 1 isoform X1 [Neodiprion pinetum]XP_046622956.1 ataxin-7-like protein 1 isoform X1 [Neodiprion virginianus]